MLGSPLPPGGDLFQRKLVDKQQMWVAKQGGPSQVGFRDSWWVARKAGPPLPGPGRGHAVKRNGARPR